MLAVLAALLGMLLSVPPAYATFPGKSGEIAYRAGSNFIFLTGSGQLTFPPPGQYDFAPAISPDGSRVAFIRQSLVTGGYFYRVMTLKTDGSDLQEVANSSPFGAAVPFSSLTNLAWNRDGKRISFYVSAGSTAQHGIWTVGEGSGLIQTVPVQSVTGLSWSPATDELLYTCTFRKNLQNQDVFDFCIFDEATGMTRHLLVDWPNAFSNSIGEPKWTPDGEKIVFFIHYFTQEGANSHAVDRYDIFSIRADGNGLAKLSDSGADVCPDYPSTSGSSKATYVYQSPTPSPDGGSIVAFRWSNVRTSPPGSCSTSIQNKGLYSLDGGLVLAVPLQAYGTDWQPIPVDLLVHVDDGHDNPLQGLRVELKTLEGVVVDDAPLDTGEGSYAFESVTPGDYVVRATLIDDTRGTAATPSFEIHHDVTDLDPVWIERQVKVAVEDRKLEPLSFHNSADLRDSSVQDPGDRERLDDMANIYFRVRQFVDWVEVFLTPDTGPEVLIYTYAETELSSSKAFGADNAAYFPDSNSILMGTDFSDYSARDTASDEAPENGEWHEFTHHLFRTFIHSDLCDTEYVNHGGYANSDTCDSMNEGFAAFLPTLAAQNITGATDSNYANRGDLEENINAWAFRYRYPGGGQVVNGEDQSVAALFWDLFDANADTKVTEVVGADGAHHVVTYTDQVNESLGSLWTRMTAGDSTATVRQLRETFGQPTLTIDLDGDGLADIAPIDEPFLMHGFFPVDTDQMIVGFHITFHYDVAYAQRLSPSAIRDDAVGLSSHQEFTAAGIVTDTFIPREHIPAVPGSNVAIDVLDASGTPLANAVVDLAIQSAGNQSGSIQRLDRGAAALMYLELPAYFDYLLPVDAPLPPCNPATDVQATATLRVTLNGYASTETQTTLDNCSYLHAVDAATGPAATSMTVTFPEDSTAPVSTMSATPTEPLTNGATPGVWKVGLSCSDPIDGGFASGCLRSEYRLDGGPVTTYRERVEVSGAGQHTFDYQSVDAASNQEGFRSVVLEIAVPEPDSALAILAGIVALRALARRQKTATGRHPA